MVIVYTIIGLVILALLWVGGIYNRLVAYKNRFKAAFSQIDVQLKRRHDLIPNLVETAKGYLSHERETLESVIRARNSAVSAGSLVAKNPSDPLAMAGLISAESQLTGALGKLFAVAEAYPDLKANQNMLALQAELRNTEDQIATSRGSYNSAVASYNIARESFPGNLVANAFGFLEAKLFELETEKEREVPRVAF
jgi:LemA protein